MIHGKLALLYDLERVAALLRDGGEPFCRSGSLAFARYLIELGCQRHLIESSGGRRKPVVRARAREVRASG